MFDFLLLRGMIAGSILASGPAPGYATNQCSPSCHTKPGLTDQKSDPTRRTPEAGVPPVCRSRSLLFERDLVLLARTSGPCPKEGARRRQGLSAFGRPAPAPRIPRTSIVPSGHAGEHRPVPGHDRRRSRDTRNTRDSQVRPAHCHCRPPGRRIQVHARPARRRSSISSGPDTATCRSTVPITPPRTGCPPWKEMLGGIYSHFGQPDGKARKGSLHRQDRRHRQPRDAGTEGLYS